MTALDKILGDIASTATGFAVVVDGVMDVSSVHAGIEDTAYYALVARMGVPHALVEMGTCRCGNPDCPASLFNTFKRNMPNAQIVPVGVVRIEEQ